MRFPGVALVSQCDARHTHNPSSTSRPIRVHNLMRNLAITSRSLFHTDAAFGDGKRKREGERECGRSENGDGGTGSAWTCSKEVNSRPAHSLKIKQWKKGQASRCCAADVCLLVQQQQNGQTCFFFHCSLKIDRRPTGETEPTWGFYKPLIPPQQRSLLRFKVRETFEHL